MTEVNMKRKTKYERCGFMQHRECPPPGYSEFTRVDERIGLDDVTIDEAIAEIVAVKAKYGAQYDVIRMEPDEYGNFFFRGERDETDDEREARIVEMNSNQSIRDARERVEFERLKAKFGA